jgi:hypothetical protein
MVDRLSTALGREAAIRKAERKVQRAVAQAMADLADIAVHALEQSGMDPAVLDTRWPDWSAIVAEQVEPLIEEVYVQAYEAPVLVAATSSPVSPANLAAVGHLASVRNRMVGVGDGVFDLIRAELTVGRDAGDSIPKLGKRVEATLASQGAATWKRRGVTVARTEVIAANNAGSHQAALGQADVLGAQPGEVAKEWLATADARTRESHLDADGEMVLGMDTPFPVGGDLLAYPGDPSGSPEEVINCRCTMLYHYPGDPDYPDNVVPLVGPPDPAAALSGLGEGPLPISMDDASLESEVADLMALGDFTSPRLSALTRELDVRDAERAFDNAPVLTAVPSTTAEQAALNKVLFGDGAPPTPRARKVRSADQLLEDDYQTWVHTQWLRAEEDTRGHMMTADGLAKGYSAPDIIGRRVSPKWATPEFQEWLAGPGNEGMSFPEFRAGIMDDKRARQANWRRRNRGWETEYG